MFHLYDVYFTENVGHMLIHDLRKIFFKCEHYCSVLNLFFQSEATLKHFKMSNLDGLKPRKK